VTIPEEYWPTVGELPGDLSRLAEIIESHAPALGVKITLAIADEFRGTKIYCHNIDALKRKARNRRIVNQYGKGVSVPEIARQAGLGERQVWSILGQPAD
jgi:Mor family transcriptional regulator